MLRGAAMRLLRAPRLPARACAAGAAAATAAAAAAAFAAAPPASAAPRMSSNRVLGDRHRVAITQFTLLQQNGKPKNEPPFGSVDECFAWVRAHGYDGLEIGVDDLRRSFMPRASYPEIVAAYRKAAAANSTPCLGVLYHITDYPGGFASTVKGGGSHPNVGPQDLDLNDPTFWSALRERLSYDKQCGAEYITFQINRELRSLFLSRSRLLTRDARAARAVPPQYLNTGGMYRDDEQYLRRVAQDIARLQEACFEQGLNFYVRAAAPCLSFSAVPGSFPGLAWRCQASLRRRGAAQVETHMDRVSEDLGAFVKVMEYCPVYFEINADISHYNFRAITQGSWCPSPHPVHSPLPFPEARRIFREAA